jgi:hypothetical protein
MPKMRQVAVAIGLTLTLAFVFAIGAAPAYAQRICESDEAPLFICETDHKEKSLALCAVEGARVDTWTAVQYRYGDWEHAEMVYPADAKQGASKLFFSHVSEGSIYHVSIRFQSGGFNYLIESFADSESDPVGNGSAGVTVTNGEGKTVAKIKCIERPLMYPGYLQMLLACDPQNPYGKAGCAKSAPLVAKPRKPVKK